jgi:glycerol-3-phosphate dehydrogenase
MDRNASIERLTREDIWDILVVGGGATGLGVAVDAASRGFKTLVLEQADFAKGTSSRSTKLVHGGVRYLEQGNISLVLEALRERGYFLRNAPHIARKQAFIIPVYSRWAGFKYFFGLKIYDLMAGKLRIGRTAFLDKETVKKRMPGVKPRGLRGGIEYFDGQFDDARMAVSLAMSCEDLGGTALNYMKVVALGKKAGGQYHIEARDAETGQRYHLKARSVINATGVFVDEVHKMDTGKTVHTVQPSQGVHLVLPSRFLHTTSVALMVPHTDDGRVLFLVPWHGYLLMGTTDTPLEGHTLEPRALDREVDFILRNAGQYLLQAPQRKDVLSVFAGLRPLALSGTSSESGPKATKDISRNHHLQVSASGLITITGGKWTTYRRMGKDAVDKAIKVCGLAFKPCITSTLKIHGWVDRASEDQGWNVYGSDVNKIQALAEGDPSLARKLSEGWPYTRAEVVWAVRQEMARTVEDVLARRFRILFLDAQAALDLAPQVAEIMREELGKDASWIKTQLSAFEKLAFGYLLRTSGANPSAGTTGN